MYWFYMFISARSEISGDLLEYVGLHIVLPAGEIGLLKERHYCTIYQYMYIVVCYCDIPQY
jgi:hypothetical protein